MRKILIYLANLTHMNEGRPSTEVLPLNIGYLATYLKANLNNECKVKLFNDPYELESETDRVVPDILASSNYIWNFRLNYLFLSHYKTRYPGIVTVMGGPNFPGKESEQKLFLKKYPDIDFYIYGEGELSFCSLVEKLINSDLDIQKLKEKRIEGVLYLCDAQLVTNGRSRRFRNLDDIPSPYLQGLFDKFLRKGYVPMIQTTRGCPFSCTYCYCGSDYFNKVESFDVNRILDEIDYICQRTKASTLTIADSNFGMMPNDYEICLKLKDSIKGYNWPIGISVATSKVNKEKVLECLSLLEGTVDFFASMQSFNEATLREIKRKNLSFDEYRAILQDIRSKKTSSRCEMIIPLPEETKDSYLLGVRACIETNMDIIDTYTCMMLKNTELRDASFVERYELEAKHRIVPRDFGRYLGKYVIETEEVCVSTSTMTLEDYIHLRGFSFVVSSFYNHKYLHEIVRYLKANKLSIYDWLTKLQERLKNDKGEAGNIYRDFVEDAEKELWDSEDELLSYFSNDRNFQKLIDGKAGTNLIQKYNAIFLSKMDSFIDVAVEVVLDNFPGVDYGFIDNLRRFCIAKGCEVVDLSKDDIRDEFSYDILSWVADGFKASIDSYRRKTRLRFFVTEKHKRTLSDLMSFYGVSDDLKGKIIERVSPKYLVRKVVNANFD